MPITVDIDGINHLSQRFKSLADPATMRTALGEAGGVVERSAKQKCPKGRTGNLAQGIQYKVNAAGTVCTIFNPVFYAPYVEYGTGLFAEKGNGRKNVPWGFTDEEGKEWYPFFGAHPYPFLRPALKENRHEVIEILRDAVKDV